MSPDNSIYDIRLTIDDSINEHRKCVIEKHNHRSSIINHQSLERRINLRERQRGFALMMGLMLLVLAVLIVTAYASMMQSAIGSSTTDSFQNTAASAAMAAVYRAAGYIINDTADTSYPDKGVVITEVLFQARRDTTLGVADTLVISQIMTGMSDPGGHPETADSEYVELFNPTSESVSLNNVILTRIDAAGIPSTWATLPDGDTIAPYSYYLVTTPGYRERDYDSGSTLALAANSASVLGTLLNNSKYRDSGTIPYGDFKGATPGLVNDNVIGIRWEGSGTWIDSVGWGAGPQGEGARLPNIPLGMSAKRIIDTAISRLPQDSNSNIQNFREPGPDTAPRNRGDTFALTSCADRRYEFIEIQNSDSIPHAMHDTTGTGLPYWIIVGDTGAPLFPADTYRRYLQPLPGDTGVGDSNVLYPFQVGVIVAKDADTKWIARMVVGQTETQVKWYALSDVSIGPAKDTMLSGTRCRALGDRGDSIILGFGATPPPMTTNPSVGWWSGAIFPDSIPIPDSYYPISPSVGHESSWQKLSIKIQDDTLPLLPSPTSGYSEFLLNPTTKRPVNWDTYTANPTPGVGFIWNTGLIDGAIDKDGLANKSWYSLAGTDFVPLSPGVYYRVRVYDEAAKVNINTIRAHNTGIDSTLQEMLSQKPPWGTIVSVYTNPQALALSNSFIASKPKAVTDSAYFYTPEGMFNRVGGYARSNYYMPYTTPYGYAKTDSDKININMAETPVLRAALIWALDPSLTQAASEVVADKIYMYLTNPLNPTAQDYDPANDTWYDIIDNVAKQTTNLTSTESAAITTNLTRMKQIFRVSSSNYFTIQATGFVFKRTVVPGADTPLARAVVLAVIRRDGISKKGEIVFWREIYEDDVTRYPIGTFRYKRYAWDPVL